MVSERKCSSKSLVINGAFNERDKVSVKPKSLNLHNKNVNEA